MKLKKQDATRKNKINAYAIEKLKQPGMRKLYDLELRNRFQARTDIKIQNAVLNMLNRRSMLNKNGRSSKTPSTKLQKKLLVSLQAGHKKRDLDERRDLKMKREQ